MTDRDLLAPFDEGTIDAVATETGISREDLLNALRQHQEHANSLPSVDDLVYEWRRFLPYDPLVLRSSEMYILALERSVWTEFGEQLSFDDFTLEAVVLVHARQASQEVTETSMSDPEATSESGVVRGPDAPFATASPMVLTR